MIGFFDSRIWKKAPFLRLLIPVISGILIQDIYAISKWVSIAVMSGGLVIMVFSLISSPIYNFRFAAVSGFLLNLVLVATGCQLRAVNQDNPLCARSPEGLSHQLIVKVRKGPERKGKSVNCLVSLQWEMKAAGLIKENEDLLIYFRDTLIPAGWIAGSTRLITATLLPVHNVHQQPGSSQRPFDYVSWCARKHIYSRAFTSPGDGLLLSLPAGFNLQQKLAALQEALRLICRRFVPAPERGGLLEALLIGYTRDLDADVMRAYSDAGVVHIIAISGLHLALIAELLQLALSLLGSSNGMKWLRLCLLLAVIWGYSLLTGASPSVLRSAVMFNFVVLARHFALQAPVYNALAASAFLLVCDDPFRLWDTGFQLSYAAVLSLVLFAAPVGQWIKPKNKLLTALWKAAAISLAAQLLTTPLSIWYFHRFPFYFLISNLVAVPLSSAILIGGIFLLALSFFPTIAGLLGTLLDGGLNIMNGFVSYTNRLPGAAATGIPISLFQVILCYSMLYTACRFFHQGEKRWVFSFLLQLCAFLVDGLNNRLP